MSTYYEAPYHAAPKAKRICADLGCVGCVAANLDSMLGMPEGEVKSSREYWSLQTASTSSSQGTASQEIARLTGNRHWGTDEKLTVPCRVDDCPVVLLTKLGMDGFGVAVDIQSRA